MSDWTIPVKSLDAVTLTTTPFTSGYSDSSTPAATSLHTSS